MEILNQINQASTKEELNEIIHENQDKLFDFFSIVNHSELLLSREDFRQLTLKTNFFLDLESPSPSVIAFVNLVLNTSIRIGDMFVFESFYRILKAKNLESSRLIEASSLFMVNVKKYDDFINRYDSIMTLLDEAYHFETDSSKDSIASLISYYSIVVKLFSEFASKEVGHLRDLILKTYSDKTFSFLNDDVIVQVCDCSIELDAQPFEKIHAILDEFVGRKRRPLIGLKGYLVEKNTEYKKEIENSRKSLHEIIRLNKRIYQPIKRDSVYYSLQRGVKILENEIQLMAYIFSFGDMHHEKLNSAFKFLPKIPNHHQVIDWGCGQGLGTISYLEYLDSIGDLARCKKITLIEPSEIAISRASLHLENWNDNIVTINKGFDELESTDFSEQQGLVSVHILSNILDIEEYSHSHLVDIIKSNFKGQNYFVIVSPVVNLTRTLMIDSFVKQFHENEKFELIAQFTEPNGKWKNNWSRLLRVFKAEIHE
jgi:hypothetical protein